MYLLQFHIKVEQFAKSIFVLFDFLEFDLIVCFNIIAFIS